MAWDTITFNKISVPLIAIILVILAFAGIMYVNSSEEDGIITKVDYDLGYVQPHWDDYETVTLNEDKLRQSLESGSVSLNLLGENVDITITEYENKNYDYYKGSVNGIKSNDAEFYIEEETCSCYVSLGTHYYQIAPTEKIIGNEMIYVLYMTDREKEVQRIEQYPIDPLTFEISNEDYIEHDISIEIFNPSNVSIFRENYSISPGETINSPEVSKVLGTYRYVVILDDDYKLEQTASVARATGLGSSEKLYFNLINDSEYPIDMAIAVA